MINKLMNISKIIDEKVYIGDQYIGKDIQLL